MANIDDILEQLLNDRRLKEGAAFSSHTYSDQPIIERGSDLKARMERRAAERAEHHQREAERRRRRAKRRQPSPEPTPTPAPRPAEHPNSWPNTLSNTAQRFFDTLDSALFSPTPERIREMRKLENGGMPRSLGYGSRAASALFHAQATMMEDYEDDYDFPGTFVQYFPTYAAMTDQQLRGYFSWRSKVRAGHVSPAPLSFAFVYVYELLGGIGTTPGTQALSDLKAFGAAYHDADPVHGTQLLSYLRRWTFDYAVYHNLEDALREAVPNPLRTAVLTLFRAEHSHLREQGYAPRIDNAAAAGASPSTDELFSALGNAASYHICDSRMAKEDHVLVAQVCKRVFNALVAHCAKRRKTDFVEGLFGYAVRDPYTMFSAAVFFEEAPHPNCTVTINEQEQFVCKNGRWMHLLACEARDRSSDLGLILHTIDFELRQRLSFAYPLKERQAPKYVKTIVRNAIDACLAERAEAEKRRITIDRSKLTGIRRAAAITQEALLTDEERGEEAAPTVAPTVAPLQPQIPLMEEHEPKVEHVPAAAPVAPAPSPVATAAPAGDEAPAPAGLSPLEARVLRGLLGGTPASQLLAPTDPFVSVVADSINEKLFDLIGDAVIEFDGDEPRIIEDYLDDVREVIAS